MKKPLILLLLVSIHFLSIANDSLIIGTMRSATGKLSGKIYDASTHKPLPGATVFIHDVKVGAVSNEDGSFVTREISSGNYLVEVSYQGYATLIENININGDTHKDLYLKVTVREQEAVTVTGVASAVRIRNATQPVSIVRRSDLLQTTSTNVIDALSKTVPGVNALSTGPAISKPVIRGLGYNRVVLINDGIRQEGQQWGDEHGIEIDEYSVQRIEVLKGPASLMYGSDAMAGVINIISNVPVTQGTIRGNLFGQYNSKNRQYGLNGNVAGHLQNGFNWNIYSTYKNAGDYKNKYDGHVLNSRFRENNMGGYIGLNKKWGYTHLLVSNVHQKLGIIEGERDAASGRFLIFPESVLEREATDEELKGREMLTPFQTIDHFKITSDNSISVGRDRLSIVAGLQRNQRKEFGDPQNMNEPELYFDLQSFNYGVQYHLAENNGWRTSFGVNGMHQSNQNKAEEVLIPEYRLFDIGGFVYTRKQFNKLSLSGGARLDTRELTSDAFADGTDLKFSAFKRNFTNMSGSVGVSYEASHELTLKANIAKGFRAPNIAELASNGAHEGTNRYEYGDKDLRSETSFQADAGLDLNTEHFSFTVNGFYNHIKDFIYYGKIESVNGSDSLVDVDGEMLTAFKFRQQNASLKGFEFNLDIHPHPFDWLHFENTVSFVRGTFANAIEGTKNLPFIPAARWKSELRFDLKRIGNAFSNSYLSVEMDRTFEQKKVFTAFNTETITPSFTLLNASVGTDITNGRRTLFSVHVGFNNITDVAYQNHLSRLKYTATNNVTGRDGVFNMGRNVNLKVNIPIDIKL